MLWPTYPKWDRRTRPVTVKLSKIAVKQLKALANKHNLSQADVVEWLLKESAADPISKKDEPRPKAVTVKVSERALLKLRSLKSKHEALKATHAGILEGLLNEECKSRKGFPRRKKE